MIDISLFTGTSLRVKMIMVSTTEYSEITGKRMEPNFSLCLKWLTKVDQDCLPMSIKTKECRLVMKESTVKTDLISTGYVSNMPEDNTSRDTALSSCLNKVTFSYSGINSSPSMASGKSRIDLMIHLRNFAKPWMKKTRKRMLKEIMI